jgi:hypothetical protein
MIDSKTVALVGTGFFVVKRFFEKRKAPADFFSRGFSQIAPTVGA